MCEICRALRSGGAEAAIRVMSREGQMVKAAAEQEVWFFHKGRRVQEGWATECLICGWSAAQLPSRFVASLRLLEHSVVSHAEVA